VVPVVVPFTFTDTPAKGRPFSVITFPITVIFCWANENEKRKKDNASINAFFLCCKKGNNIFDIAINLVLKNIKVSHRKIFIYR
jgi:hypothetical protein